MVSSNLALGGGRFNLMLSPEPTIGFCKLKALALDGRCKTFDAAADGYGRGEACGPVKPHPSLIPPHPPRRAEAAARDLLMTLPGSHSGSGARLCRQPRWPQQRLTRPQTVPPRKAVLRQRPSHARVEPQQLQYVEVPLAPAPASATPSKCWPSTKVMGQRPTPLLIGSVKTNIGHLESAAGVAGLIKGDSVPLQHQQISSSSQSQTPNPYNSLGSTRPLPYLPTYPLAWYRGTQTGGILAPLA